MGLHTRLFRIDHAKQFHKQVKGLFFSDQQHNNGYTLITIERYIASEAKYVTSVFQRPIDL